MHNNKITKVFALFISLVLVFAVVFSVAACSKKKPNKTIEKQTEQQVKGRHWINSMSSCQSKIWSLM